jgi:hypothetical protein
MKNTGHIRIALVCAAFILISIAALRTVGAAQHVVQVPRADQLRFQLIGNEPIAGPDGRAIVKDWTVLLFKDRRSGQCYLVFARDAAIGTTDAAPCPDTSTEGPLW